MELPRKAIHLKHISPQGIPQVNETTEIRAGLDSLMDTQPKVEDETQQRT